MAIKNTVGARATIVPAAPGLPKSPAICLEPNSITRHPRRPMPKNSQKATEKTWSASLRRPIALAVPTIRDTAIGSPAVESTRKMVKISYAP